MQIMYYKQKFGVMVASIHFGYQEAYTMSAELKRYAHKGFIA